MTERLVGMLRMEKARVAKCAACRDPKYQGETDLAAWEAALCCDRWS